MDNLELVYYVWENAADPPAGYSPLYFRLDPCGALMYIGLFEFEANLGWNIDHIYPVSKGGDDELENLRAMQYQNIAQKANKYPNHLSAVTYNKGLDCNIPLNEKFVVPYFTQGQLEDLYEFES
jgi:hypothetical protein